MHWIAPSEKETATDMLEKRLWDSADQFRANSGLKAQEYSGPILGIIFLRFAEVRFAQRRAKLDGRGAGGEGYSGEPTREVSVHVAEKTDETGRLCRMVGVRKDLAVLGFSADFSSN